MTKEAYIAFLLASIIITFTPGPTVLLVIKYALQYGKKIARYTVSATLLGDIVAVNLAFSSLGTLLAISPNAITVLKIIGGIYIFNLGVISIFSYNQTRDQAGQA
jgi:threonine/homoserine/homoserine lactone efflux protein